MCDDNPDIIVKKIIIIAERNPVINIRELRDVLMKIADNILKDPGNPTYKVLKKNNATINRKILSLKGGCEFLKCMGFADDGDNFTFNVSHIDQLTRVRKALGAWEPCHRPEISATTTEGIAGPSQSHSIETSYVKKCPLPKYVNNYKNPFLRKVAESFHNALIYNNIELKEKARSKIPVHLLQLKAQKKMRNFQKAVKEGNVVEAAVSIEDFVLVELLDWFKNEFFEWIDTPFCDHCFNETKFSHTNTNTSNTQYTERVEVYKCLRCEKFTMFHRFNDLNILLVTKRGRCGEWANVFTLMCHAMGWDARFVLDETDHVWTEVFSPVQNRWLHCDPCEAICDKPLIYEHGWKKNLSYVMAYSPLELQDVTWRYSSNHKEILKRRKLCSEDDLAKAIVDLRNDRLKQLSSFKRTYILKRAVNELAELMIERQPNNDEKSGRVSGGLDWRIARGETEDNKWTSHTFFLFKTQLVIKKIRITYSCALDKYYTEGESFANVSQWSDGAFDMKNIMRKVETDWRQTYICRKEGETEGYISWKVILENTEKKIDSVFLKMSYKTFENGKLRIKASGDKNVSKDLSDDHLTTTVFRGSKSLLIEAHFSGGKGDLAWQHAQLFRQPIDSKEFPLELFITFN